MNKAVLQETGWALLIASSPGWLPGTGGTPRHPGGTPRHTAGTMGPGLRVPLPRSARRGAGRKKTRRATKPRGVDGRKSSRSSPSSPRPIIYIKSLKIPVRASCSVALTAAFLQLSKPREPPLPPIPCCLPAPSPFFAPSLPPPVYFHSFHLPPLLALSFSRFLPPAAPRRHRGLGCGVPRRRGTCPKDRHGGLCKAALARARNHETLTEQIPPLPTPASPTVEPRHKRNENENSKKQLKACTGTRGDSARRQHA